jgi:hypothetical protein
MVRAIPEAPIAIPAGCRSPRCRARGSRHEPRASRVACRQHSVRTRPSARSPARGARRSPLARDRAALRERRPAPPATALLAVPARRPAARPRQLRNPSRVWRPRRHPAAPVPRRRLRSPTATGRRPGNAWHERRYRMPAAGVSSHREIGAAVRDLAQRGDIEDGDFMWLRQVDDPALAKLRKRAADGLDRKAQTPSIFGKGSGCDTRNKDGDDDDRRENGADRAD